MRIAVLGGGNGSFAAAGDLALAGHDIRLWRRDREAAAAHRAAGGLIVVKDFRGSREAKPALITDDIAAAVRDAELILCPAPAPAQSDIARLLAPHLVAGQVVFLSPGTFGTFVFAKAATAPRYPSPKPAHCRGSRASTDRSRSQLQFGQSGCRPGYFHCAFATTHSPSSAPPFPA
jgi:hypothetical protein